MTVQFNTIPNASLRVPLFYAEINGAQTPFVSPSRLLLVGQKLPAGSAPAGHPIQVQSDPRTLFGINSMLVDMVKGARDNAPFQEIWALPLDDSNTGTKATATVTLPRALTAVAVITTNVANPATGAPDAGDGHTFLVNDKVLLVGQTDKTKNGLYSVGTVGTGVNGVWTRDNAMNASGEFENGLTVAVSAGTVYAGSVWRLSRGSSFTMDTTEVVFTRGGMVAQSASISLWVGDVQVRVVAQANDTGATCATRLAAAINAIEGCPFTATASSNVVTLTAHHAGTAYNSVYLDTDFYGNEGPLASTLFVIAQPSGGSGDPDIAAVLPNLSDEPFDWIVGPYADPVTMGAFDGLLNGVSGRWSPYQQLYGHYVGTMDDTDTNVQTYTRSLNTETTSVFGTYHAASPIWKTAGVLGGRIAAHLSDAPELSRPLQTLEMIGLLPPKLPANRPNMNTRNTGYFSGASSYRTEGRQMRMFIDRIITNYRVNDWGSPDAAWLDIETRAQNMYSVRGLKAAITGNHPRCILMDENPDGLQGVATPQDIRNTIVHEYKRQNLLGVVENPDLFAASLIVERSAQDANRVDVYLPSDVANQLRIVAVNYTSFLQRAA